MTIYDQTIFTNFLKDILYFPLWWYSNGLVHTLNKLKQFLSDKQKSLGLLIWIKNIFNPMYGQYSWEGIIVSFVMRFVQIIIRSIIMLFWLIVCLGILCLWIGLPIFTIYEIIIQLS